jgi:cell division protein FtsB
MPARAAQAARKPVRRRSRLWLVVVAGACLVSYLYYRPVKAYVSASHQLSARQAEVRALQREKAQLERRLAASGTGQSLFEEARRLGYVRPGEHLFVVRGIKDWLAAHPQAAHGH